MSIPENSRHAERMFVLALLFAATLPKIPETAAIDVSSGAALVRGCDAELRLMQPDALEKASSADLADGSYCVGYLNGYLASLGTAPSSICTGEQTMATLLRNYLSFMGENPSLLGKDKRIGLRLSLEHRFPCPQPQSAVTHASPSQRNRL